MNHLQVKPIESFSGQLINGYSFKFNKSNKYSCFIENNVYYVIDKYGYNIPFEKGDFNTSFKIIISDIR